MSPSPLASPGAWLALALAVLAAHALALAYAWLRRPPDTDASSGTGSGTAERTPPDSPEESVCCPHCDAKNDPSYRFCRACVTELPGGGTRTPRASRPSSGFAR